MDYDQHSGLERFTVCLTRGDLNYLVGSLSKSCIESDGSTLLFFFFFPCFFALRSFFRSCCKCHSRTVILGPLDPDFALLLIGSTNDIHYVLGLTMAWERPNRIELSCPHSRISCLNVFDLRLIEAIESVRGDEKFRRLN